MTVFIFLTFIALYIQYKLTYAKKYKLIWKWPEKKEKSTEKVSTISQSADNFWKHFWIARRLSGKKHIAIKSVPYAIHTTPKPQNINDTDAIAEESVLILYDLARKYVKMPAKRGWEKIRSDHASTKGSMKKIILKGENTAVW